MPQSAVSRRLACAPIPGRVLLPLLSTFSWPKVLCRSQERATSRLRPLLKSAKHGRTRRTRPEERTLSKTTPVCMGSNCLGDSTVYVPGVASQCNIRVIPKKSKSPLLKILDAKVVDAVGKRIINPDHEFLSRSLRSAVLESLKKPCGFVLAFPGTPPTKWV